MSPKVSYNTHMKMTKIADLKNKLSYYLERVKKGETILVLDRTTPVARIVPIEAPSSLPPKEDDSWLRRMEAGGVVHRGAGKGVPEIWKTPPPGRCPVGAVDALIEERRVR
jgi:prevent-host-death family protein